MRAKIAIYGRLPDGIETKTKVVLIISRTPSLVSVVMW